MKKGLRHACAARTLCEVAREICDLHQGQTDHDKATRKKLSEIEDMAKRMSRKLKEYNKHYDKDWWAANPDYEKDLERRLSTKYCTE